MMNQMELLKDRGNSRPSERGIELLGPKTHVVDNYFLLRLLKRSVSIR